MKIELVCTSETRENGELINIWKIDKNDGTIVININKLFDDNVLECRWIDDEHCFLEVIHMGWEGTEVWAIVDKYGEIVRENLLSVESYIEERSLFIAYIKGIGLSDFELNDFNMLPDDENMSVLDRNGNFIIPPIYDKINYYDDEKIFVCKKYGNNEVEYSLYGIKVEKENEK